MSSEPEKSITLNLARARLLNSVHDWPDESEPDEQDAEDAAEDFQLAQEELAEKTTLADIDRTLGITGDERENLWASFSGSRTIFQFWNTIVGILFGLGLYASLVAINKLLAGSSDPTQVHLYPQAAMWWFFPGFAAYCLAWDIRVLLWTLFGNSRTARLYRIWANRHTAGEQGVFATSAFNRWCIRLLVLPMGILTLLTLNMHSTVGPKSIRECGYAFRPCKVYPLADASRMTEIQGFRSSDGKLTKQAGIVIDFKDGRRWSSAGWGDFEPTVDPILANSLIQRTNLPLNRAITEDDIPPINRR